MVYPRAREACSDSGIRPCSGACLRAQGQTPERVFAAEINRGELPSLRAIKARMHVGTDRARAIRDQLSEILQEAPEAA